VFLLLSAGVLVALAALLYWAHRRGRLLAASLVVFTLAAVASGLAYAVFETGYRDADGTVDCWPDCTAVQDATGYGLFLAPVVAVLAASFAGVALVLGALNRRRSNVRRDEGA
jgi:hypothetical protein